MGAPCFHLLAFEGPDRYASAGGIATRVTGLARALADLGFETHLWFVGDPNLPGHEDLGPLHLHRWCQWISRYHPLGVYDGEEGKRNDYCASLPPRLLETVLPGLRQGGRAVVLAEEWHTAGAVLHLDALLQEAGVRDRVRILWNANNTYGFDQVDWARLNRAATVTTVSRYMKHILEPRGVDALVLPNGLGDEAFAGVDPEAARAFRRLTRGRVVLTKVARFDPDKRWLQAVGIVAELESRGYRPLFIARGGIEAHGHEVLQAARRAGFRVTDRPMPAPGAAGVLGSLENLDNVDVLHVTSHLDWESRRLLYAQSAAVLSNSSHEPFGLVGLETMAARGLAVTGSSGEDYAIPGHNALVLQTAEPGEFVDLFHHLRGHPGEERAIRRAGQATAQFFAWRDLVRRTLLPRLAIDRAPLDETVPHLRALRRPARARVDRSRWRTSA